MKKELFFKRLLSLLIILCCTFGFSQDFDYTITDANMTVQVGADVCSSVMEQGDLLGAFFTNASGDLQNAGYLEFEGDQLAVAVWASESGLNNGFEAGDDIQWMMYDASEGSTIALDSEMNSSPPFSPTFQANGFGQVLSLSVAVEGECADDDTAMAAFGGCAAAVAALGCDFEFMGAPVSDSCPVSCDSCPSDCADDASVVSAFGGCAGAVAALGCDFVFAGVPIGESCPVSCDSCGGESGPVLGCTDESADNYDSSATEDDGSCIISGCMCDLAVNYNASANNEDGSCVVMSGGCGDATALNYSGDACASANFIANDCQFEAPEPGPMEYTITDANMTVQVSANVVFMNGDTPAPIGSLLGAYYTNDAGELMNAGYEVLDGDDQYAIAVWASESGLDNGFAPGEDITWVLQIGDDLFVADAVEMNSNPPFSTTFMANGFGQILNAEFSGEFTADTPGCTDDTACNYDASATSDDGSCAYAADGLDCNGDCLADADGDGVCDGDELSGCQDTIACNYDSSATDDDGSCTYAAENFDCDGNCTVDVDCNGDCGGDAVADNCGTCDNESSNDCTKY